MFTGNVNDYDDVITREGGCIIGCDGDSTCAACDRIGGGGVAVDQGAENLERQDQRFRYTNNYVLYKLQS